MPYPYSSLPAKEEEFQLKACAVEKKITPRTKLLLLNSPCNPTGSMMQQEELAKIASLALRHRFFIVSDEIYSEIVFDGRKHVSIANLEPRVKELTITVNGFSKAYAMTGWRVGYAAGPGPIITAMGNVQGHFTSGTNTMAQKAAIAAVYGPQDFIREMVEEYDRRRRYIVKRLNSIPGISCFSPHGTFYAFPDVSGLLNRTFRGTRVRNTLELGNYLLESEGVAVVPGSAFEGRGAPAVIFCLQHGNNRKRLRPHRPGDYRLKRMEGRILDQVSSRSPWPDW